MSLIVGSFSFSQICSCRIYTRLSFIVSIELNCLAIVFIHSLLNRLVYLIRRISGRSPVYFQSGRGMFQRVLFWAHLIIVPKHSSIRFDSVQQTGAHSINTFSWRKLPGRRKLKMSAPTDLVAPDIHLYLWSLGFTAWYSIKKRMSCQSGLYSLDYSDITEWQRYKTR